VSSSHGSPSSRASGHGLAHHSAPTTSSDSDLTPHGAPGDNAKRFFHNMRSRLPTIQESSSGSTRDIEGSHRPPIRLGSKTQSRSTSPTQFVASSAGQPMNHQTQPDGRHAVPDGHETNPAQLCHDTTQDTIPCTSEVIQGSGILFVLQLTGEPGNLPVQAVSDNSQRLVGRTPSELLSLKSFSSRRVCRTDRSRPIPRNRYRCE
jgi:hypothetical protein